MLKVNLDFVTKQAERAHSRKILEKCRKGFKYVVCASPPPPPPPQRDINKHVARDFLKMFSSEAKNNLITAKNSFELNINNLKKVGTKLSTII